MPTGTQVQVARLSLLVSSRNNSVFSKIFKG
jgi:hypothetical protein